MDKEGVSMSIKTDRKETIQTTTGLYKLSENDRILVHEHVFNRYPFWKQEIMEEEVLKELNAIHDEGITVICDLTAYTKPYNYYKVIENSPVKILSCAGFYTPRYVSNQLKKQDVDTLAQSIRKTIIQGSGKKEIKPGILKVAAESYQLSYVEKKFFSVIAMLSDEFDLPVALHAPKGTYDHAYELISLGIKPNRLFVAHIENGITSETEFEKRIQEALKIMGLGAFVQLADFGCTRTSKKRKAALSFASKLIDRGYIEQLLLSADSCWRFKEGQFVVKESNLGDGKHYTYTKNFIIPLLQQLYHSRDIEQIILSDNARKLFLY